MYGIEYPEVENRCGLDVAVWHDIGEGPWNTRMEAERFLDCEVGAPGARVYQLAPDNSPIRAGADHSVIHTGGNVYNDYISDFDASGRVLIVGPFGIYLFASDRDYQMQCDPIAETNGPDTIEEYSEPVRANSWLAGIESSTDYVRVQDTSGATLTVYRRVE